MQSDWNLIGGLMALLFAMALIAAIFLIFRALVLWYFRINETVALLKSIDERLKILQKL